MGSQEESQEKTEEATPRKLRDARKKGQVAKSRDLNAVLLLLIAFGILAALNSFIDDRLRLFLQHCFETIPRIGAQERSQDILMNLLREGFQIMIYILSPIVIVVFGAALLISFLQVGPVFSAEPIKPNWDKLNPVKGLKNIFKLRSFVELIKSTFKIVIVFLIAYFVIKQHLHDLTLSVTASLVPTLKLAGQILLSFMVKVGIFFLIIALFDLLYQRWQYGKDLRMSKYEVMQEFKRDEGDPMLKSHRRQMHQELGRGEMAKVAKSDVVVVNPVHIAVAVLYDRHYMNAPQVMVKGERLVAEQIKNIAHKHEIPVVENVPLAHALFELEPGDEIPEDIYEAMAEVLSFVYRLKQVAV